MAKDRNIALKFGDFETTIHYSERLKFKFDNEIISEHFGNSWSLSFEVFSAQFFPNPKNMKVKKNKKATHFHSHFSNVSKQNSATSHARMLVLDKCLMGGGGVTY